MDLDIIKEIGNIGVGSASTALSNITDKSINISIPSVYKKSVNDFLKTVSYSDKNICLMIYSNVVGEISGGLLTMYTKNFLEELLGKDVRNFNKIDRYRIMKYNEILTYSYIHSIGKFLNIDLVTMESQIIDKRINSILLNLILSDISRYDEVIINETKIFLEKKENTCYIALFLTKNDYEKLFKIVRERYGV